MPRGPKGEKRPAEVMWPCRVMPRFASTFLIALVSAAGSCSSEQLAQKQVEKKDIRQQLATAYESCVRTSFASQLPTMVDRNMAIDQAFTVCQTEEKNFKMSAMRPSRPTATR